MITEYAQTVRATAVGTCGTIGTSLQCRTLHSWGSSKSIHGKRSTFSFLLPFFLLLHRPALSFPSVYFPCGVSFCALDGFTGDMGRGNPVHGHIYIQRAHRADRVYIPWFCLMHCLAQSMWEKGGGDRIENERNHLGCARLQRVRRCTCWCGLCKGGRLDDHGLVVVVTTTMLMMIETRERQGTRPCTGSS